MVFKNCIICGNGFLAFQSARTCSTQCSHINCLNILKRWRTANPNYKKNNNNHCLVCKILILNESIHCQKCAFKEYLKKNIHPLKGRTIKPEIKLKMSLIRKGKQVSFKNPNWKGGRIVNGKGYIQIYSPNHPYRINGKYVLEHRLVMEKKIGRYLKPDEVIHHKNHDKGDNHIENLILFKNEAEHAKFHYNEYYNLHKFHSEWLLSQKENDSR